MTILSNTQVALACASMLALLMTASFFQRWRQNRLPWPVVLVAAIECLLMLFLALCYQDDELSFYHVAAIGQSIAILTSSLFLLGTTFFKERQSLQRTLVIAVFVSAATSIVLLGVHLFGILVMSPQWLALFVTYQLIVAIVITEQVLRSAQHTRFIRLLCISLLLIFALDIFSFTQFLISGTFSDTVLQIRAAISLAFSVLLSVSAVSLDHSKQSASFSLSRPAAFYSTSLAIAGAFLILSAAGGYWVRYFSGGWNEVVFVFATAMGVALIVTVLTSQVVQRKINVLIGKHLFRYKYDYREEWLRLISRLATSTMHHQVYDTSMDAVMEMFRAEGAAVWIQDGDFFVLQAQKNVNVMLNQFHEHQTSSFIESMQNNEWVFLNDIRSFSWRTSSFDKHIPDWVLEVPNFWLVFPLINDKSLLGFMLLTHSEGSQEMSWEDLDLLKTIGKQIGSFIARHRQAESLTEMRQFSAYNQLSAFLMHDLKNLIAQQSLLVANADKHKDNPEFIDDTINTVRNSVQRMDTLLRKLRVQEPDLPVSLDLKQVTMDALNQCRDRLPVPSLANVPNSVTVLADQENLKSVLVNIVSNAQDATDSMGYIDISFTTGAQSISIYIDDNGSGMDQEFIESRLFKPFDSTKQSKGMGIGLFQSREYIKSIGGTISVQSTVGAGTMFVITLPRYNSLNETSVHPVLDDQMIEQASPDTDLNHLING